MRSGLTTLLALTATAGGCADGAGAADGGPGTEARTMDRERTDGKEAHGLPGSFGRSFATLDAYLDHLERYAGPVGQPWFRKIGPDAYEQVSTERPPSQPRTYSRDELMRKFGFTR